MSNSSWRILFYFYGTPGWSLLEWQSSPPPLHFGPLRTLADHKN